MFADSYFRVKMVDNEGNIVLEDGFPRLPVVGNVIILTLKQYRVSMRIKVKSVELISNDYVITVEETQ